MALPPIHNDSSPAPEEDAEEEYSRILLRALVELVRTGALKMGKTGSSTSPDPSKDGDETGRSR